MGDEASDEPMRTPSRNGAIEDFIMPNFAREKSKITIEEIPTSTANGLVDLEAEAELIAFYENLKNLDGTISPALDPEIDAFFEVPDRGLL